MRLRSCIEIMDKKQYNFLFLAKNQKESLEKLRIVLKVVMLYSYIVKERRTEDAEEIREGRLVDRG